MYVKEGEGRERRDRREKRSTQPEKKIKREEEEGQQKSSLKHDPRRACSIELAQLVKKRYTTQRIWIDEHKKTKYIVTFVYRF